MQISVLNNGAGVRFHRNRLISHRGQLGRFNRRNFRRTFSVAVTGNERVFYRFKILHNNSIVMTIIYCHVVVQAVLERIYTRNIQPIVVDNIQVIIHEYCNDFDLFSVQWRVVPTVGNAGIQSDSSNMLDSFFFIYNIIVIQNLRFETFKYIYLKTLFSHFEVFFLYKLRRNVILVI